MLPKISVVIPSYNCGQYIGETIDNILNQGYPNIQCLVIDGGSDDGTVDILKQYGGRIEWVSEKDVGQSDAINKGLRRADGDILTYINADDVYIPGCLQKIAETFNNNPQTMWAYGKCRIIDGSGREIRKAITWYKRLWQKSYSYNKLLVLDFLAQPAVFWRRELTEEIGLLDVNQHMVMEYEYWLRTGAKHKPVFIDEYLALFRYHPVSKSALGFTAAARDALNVAKKYAASQKRGYLTPLQYLNYLTVVSVYSVLKIFKR